MEKIITIKEEFIKLDSLLKYSSVAHTGGHAKMLILDGLVLVNNEVCLKRGKNIKSGDKVKIEDIVLLVK